MQEDKKKKWKSFLGRLAVFAVLLGISIATSSVNLTNELHDFVLGFFNAAMEYGDKENDTSTIYVKGNHVEITVGEYQCACSVEEILHKESNPQEVLQKLKEEKTLAYYGEKAGFAVTKKQIEARTDELKKQLKEADSNQYKALCDEWETEKNLWKIMEDSIKEQLLAERVLAEETEELAGREDVENIEEAWQSYVDELVEKEKFYFVEENK